LPTIDVASGELRLSVSPAARAATGEHLPQTHFTTIDPAHPPAAHPSHLWLRIVSVAVLFSLGGLLAYGVWAAMQPPSADRLYALIIQADQTDDPRDLLDVQDDIDTFSQLYPHDPRLAELEPILAKISTYRLQRRLEKSRAGSTPDQTPLEGLYRQGVRLRESDPEVARRKLAALLTLLETDPAHRSPEVVGLGALVKKQLEEIDKDLIAQHELYAEFARQRLDQAKESSATDPHRARQMFQAIIDLFGDDAWANEIVKQAKHELARQRIPVSETTDLDN
jgi:hypothetical protein